MSNELNNIVCQNADGAYEGVAIGGDRYHQQRLFAYVSVNVVDMCACYNFVNLQSVVNL